VRALVSSPAPAAGPEGGARSRWRVAFRQWGHCQLRGNGAEGAAQGVVTMRDRFRTQGPGQPRLGGARKVEEVIAGVQVQGQRGPSM
jgi:hypothetical protein